MSAARARGAGPAAVALLTPGSEGGRPAAKLVVKALGTLTSGVTPAARFLLREKGKPRHLREHVTSGLRHGRVQRWAGPPDAAAPGRPDLLPPRVLGCRSSARVQAASPRQVCRWRQLSSPLHTWRRVRVRVPACPARGAAGEPKPSRHPPPRPARGAEGATSPPATGPAAFPCLGRRRQGRRAAAASRQTEWHLCACERRHTTRVLVGGEPTAGRTSAARERPC